MAKLGAMRWSLLWLFVIVGCSPWQQPPVAGPIPTTPRPHPATPPTQPVASSPVPVAAADLTVSEAAGIRFQGIAFDSRAYRLVVADQAGGPGSQWLDAAAAARAHHGVAAINAGFFTPAGEPLGKVVSNRRSAGRWNTSSLGSGVWYQDRAGSSAITRRETLNTLGAMQELLQAGPLLVDAGHAVSGLEPLKVRLRSILLWDGGNRWWLGQTSPCSLASLGQTLATSSPAGWPVRYALNLDGGRSADLWVSSTVTGGPLTLRPPWQRPVRNFLVVVPR